MKKILILVITLLPLISELAAQKPTIMVVPSDAWCKAHNYGYVIDNGGENQFVCDYKKALLEDFDLKAVISKINSIFSKRGYPLKDLESNLKTLSADATRNAATNFDRQSKGKTNIAETMREKVEKIAKCDMTIEVDWSVKKSGPMSSVYFILDGKDSYINEAVSSASGDGKPSMSSSLTVLLEEAVLARIDNFTADLDRYFQNLVSEGRKIRIDIERWTEDGTWDKNFESEFNGDELKLIIKNWMSDNTKGGNFETVESSENRLVYSPVRIPIEEE